MLPAHLVGYVLSLLIGLSLGLIGAGGSIITVPVLVYALEVEPHRAAGMSLAIVGTTSLFGAGLHFRRGNVRAKTGLLFGASGVVGAFAGAQLTHLLSPAALLTIFAALMLGVAIRMLTHDAGGESNGAVHEPRRAKAVLAGVVTGTLTGFLGVGGGFLIVPALVLFAGLAMKQAVATSLVVIALNCAAGLAGHLGQGSFDAPMTLAVTALAVAGMFGGVAISHRLPSRELRRGFAVFVILVAVFLFARNLPLLLAG
jgi:uncharacterized membrane protein YfcA